MINSTNIAKYQNRIFFSVLVLLIFGSVTATYVRVVVNKNYQIVAETSCDPTLESCFVYTCDPVDDSECPVNEEERTSYYKMVSKKAANIATCEATTEKIGCDTELSCTQGEEDCSYTLCDVEDLVEEQECSNPLISQD